ncbi:MAG TPA: cytochrome c3 family protein [Spirochaetota bacterium]|nr:cytochrome c3 family protein [Spirochaetota bacterium]HOR94036.1 cytochrome c3 family protein [Spirochaetota bacterium]HOT19895.1 cytochrome c3 family protein [Spirochaetota bacterium]HPK43397.1 cytochrome c3 family protein [Spirochaetota bacterium]HQG42484.1 cytochrome c3 family protein [Spirochaetota bacterium]
MNKKNAALISCLILLIPAFILAQSIVKVKKTTTVPKQGTVTFNHQIHKARGITDCKICHHTGSTAKKCGDNGCHWQTQNKGYNAIHTKCLGCHRTKGGKAPTLCTQCHKR